MAKLERLVTPKGVQTITKNGEFDVVAIEKVFVDVEGKVEIPQVSNLAIDEDGILTFDLPDYSELEQYNPTISYIININDNVIETSGNSANVKEYANEGENNVVVTTKVAINGLGKDGVVEYVPSEDGKYTIFTINLTDENNLTVQLSSQYLSASQASHTIDWGDGTSETDTGALDKSHTYSSVGIYNIKIVSTINTTSSEMYIAFSGYNYCKYIIDFSFQKEVVNSIHDYWCYNATGITEAIITEGITLICDSAFSGCTNLTKVELPSSLVTIEDAFGNCLNLTQITIPSNVTSIKKIGIGSETNKATFIFKGEIPPTLSSSNSLHPSKYNLPVTIKEIRVPASAVDTYKTATNWTKYVDYIVADTEG